jgi:hypothetical protein
MHYSILNILRHRLNEVLQSVRVATSCSRGMPKYMCAAKSSQGVLPLFARTRERAVRFQSDHRV